MDTNQSSKDGKPKTQASCELCQRRKIRCDKANPCSTCQRAGVKCEVPARRRLPRGRNGGRRKGDTDLKARIAKLENLVSTLGGGATSSDSLPQSLSPEPGQVPDGLPSKEPSSDMSRYLGSSFWSNLSSEVGGLREVLDDTSESDSETPELSEPANSPPGMAAQGFNFVLCGPDSFMMAPKALDSPPKHVVEALYTLYFRNVDPLFKVLHAPSMAEYMLEGKPYLGHEPGDPAIDALSFSIYYAGLNTIDAPSCKQRFGEDKSDLLNKYRFALEVCLAKANFINTTEIEVLQAFVIFLASVRVNDRSRWAWTLSALAFRMAQALGLHDEDGVTSRKPFDTEMRRRLWHQIGILDIHAAMDRGTDPMLLGKIKGQPPPANVNDSDISPDMEGPIVSREGFTEESFCLMSHDGEPFVRKLIYVQGGETEEERAEIEQTWHKRQETVTRLWQIMHEKYLRHCDMTIPLHWFAKKVGEVMGYCLMLFAIRPMFKHPDIKPPQVKGFNVLNVAVDAMERNQEILTNPVTEPWRWFTWVQWHALAVALAELCSYTEGPGIERAWRVVDAAYERYAGMVADTEKGMLWHPIEKLMKKAKQNSKLAQMAKLNLGDSKGETANRVIETLRQPEARPNLDVGMQPMQQQTLSPNPNTTQGIFADPQNSPWTAGINSMSAGSSAKTPFSQSSAADGFQSLSTTSSLPSDPIPLDLAPFGDMQDANNFPLDMAWTNWEDFVGEVNLGDFDMSDPTAGLPQP